MDWNDPKLSKLKAKWYAKLKKKGFEDIEHDERNLKQFSGKTSIDDELGRSKLERWAQWGKLPQIKNHIKYEYFSECRRFLEIHKFKNKTERKMFEMHSDGLGVRVIAVSLKTYRRKVHETIQRLVKVMRGK